MACPICDQKPANCDCTSVERHQYAEIEELRDEIASLKAWAYVTERLPEPEPFDGDTIYLVAVRTRDGATFTDRACFKAVGDRPAEWIEDSPLNEPYYCGWQASVYAWMPLPSPPPTRD